MSDRLLTERELCAFLSVSRPFLWACRHEGMPFIRLSPNTIRYDLDTVLKWFENRSKKTKRSFEKMKMGEVFDPNGELRKIEVERMKRGCKEIRPDNSGIEVDYNFVPRFKSYEAKVKSDIQSYAGLLLEIVGARTLIVGVDEDDKPFVLFCDDRLNNALDIEIDEY